MTYERESLIEKHLVAEVKKAGGVAFKFVSPGRRSVPDRCDVLMDAWRARTLRERKNHRLHPKFADC